jgi:hypothetical protein
VIFAGLKWLAQEILNQAEEELYDEDKVHGEMSEAYALMESGAISEEEFERREADLVGRLEEIEARRRAADGEDGEDDEDAEDDGEDDADGEDADSAEVPDAARADGREP